MLLFASLGALGWALGLLTETVSALLSESGGLLCGSSAVPHSGLGLPAALFPSSVSAGVALLLAGSGLGIPAPGRPVPVHQLPASASAGRLAPPTGPQPRGRGNPAAATPRTEPRASARIPRCSPAPARARWWSGRRSAGRRAARCACGSALHWGTAGKSLHNTFNLLLPIVHHTDNRKTRIPPESIKISISCVKSFFCE